MSKLFEKKHEKGANKQKEAGKQAKTAPGAKQPMQGKPGKGNSQQGQGQKR